MRKAFWNVAAFGMFLFSCLNPRWPKDLGLARWRVAMGWRNLKLGKPLMRVYMRETDEGRKLER